jgi:hypothetical protein
MSQSMKGGRRYLAVLLHEGQVGTGDDVPLYEEAFVLLRASSVEQARQRAAAYAANQHATYVNDRGEPVSWSLKHVVDVAEVLEEETGGEPEALYARHFRSYDAYRAFEPQLGGPLEPDEDHGRDAMRAMALATEALRDEGVDVRRYAIESLTRGEPASYHPLRWRVVFKPREEASHPPEEEPRLVAGGEVFVSVDLAARTARVTGYGE